MVSFEDFIYLLDETNRVEVIFVEKGNKPFSEIEHPVFKGIKNEFFDDFDYFDDLDLSVVMDFKTSFDEKGTFVIIRVLNPAEWRDFDRFKYEE